MFARDIERSVVDQGELELEDYVNGLRFLYNSARDHPDTKNRFTRAHYYGERLVTFRDKRNTGYYEFNGDDDLGPDPLNNDENNIKSSSPPLVKEIYDALKELRTAWRGDAPPPSFLSDPFPALDETHANHMVRTLRISRRDPRDPTNTIRFELHLLPEDATTSHETTMLVYELKLAHIREVAFQLQRDQEREAIKKLKLAHERQMVKRWGRLVGKEVAAGAVRHWLSGQQDEATEDLGAWREDLGRVADWRDEESEDEAPEEPQVDDLAAVAAAARNKEESALRLRWLQLAAGAEAKKF